MVALVTNHRYLHDSLACGKPSTKLESRVKSPLGPGAAQRAAERLFAKSPGWKERFRAQCINRINDMKYNIQTQNRQAQALKEGYNSANMDSTISAIPFALPSPDTSSEHTNSDWVGPFVENELSHFEYQDDDWDIGDDFTIEEQLALLGDLSDVWQREKAEQGALHILCKSSIYEKCRRSKTNL